MSDLDVKIDSRWIRENAPGAICKFQQIPLIPLPNTDRDSGIWFLGIDRKHEHTTVILYLGKPGAQAGHRRIATIQTRRELIRLYEHLVGEGEWTRRRSESSTTIPVVLAQRGI